MAVTPSSIKLLFPELEDVPDERVELFIEMAERRVSREAWGVRADDGVRYLTAHLLTQSAKGAKAAAGPVASVSVGDVSQSYAVSGAVTESSLGATPYGREFLELRGLVFASRVV